MTDRKNNDFLAQIVEHGIVSHALCNILLTRYGGDSFALLLHLVQSNPQNRTSLGRLWGNSLGVAYVDPARTLIQEDLVQRMPEDFAKKNKVLPLYEVGGAVTVACSAPADQALISQVEQRIDAFVSPVFSFPDQIGTALEIAYESVPSIERIVGATLLRLADIQAPANADELKKLSEESTIITFVRSLLLFALKKRASDIHIEPGAKLLRVRFRVDGVLQEVFKLDLALLPPVVTRLKVLANVDIAESRKPHDARFQLAMPDRAIDFRFSSVPTIHGEKVVLRVLGHSHFIDVPELDDIGFSKTLSDKVKRAIEMPNGIFLVAGPTGCGKTTTLYAILKYLNYPSSNIITIEDPVEYTLEGISQVQVNEILDFTFAPALRSFLRQDPDVILVGEVRDGETATIACRAALTGHLVFSTIHTNNAVQAITRLLDLGVDMSLLAPSLIGVMSQRMVRRLCDHCKEKYELSAETIRELFDWDGETRVFFWKSGGCEKCDQTGYFGRIAIHEIVLVNDALQALISRNASIVEIQKCAESAGYTPLRYDGLKKVLRGLTTVEEVKRITFQESED